MFAINEYFNFKSQTISLLDIYCLYLKRKRKNKLNYFKAVKKYLSKLFK